MEALKKYNLNIKLYKYYVILSNSLFIWPIIVVFLRSKNLSFTEIMLINSVASFLTLVLEIPTGVYADKMGKKRSIVIGNFFKLIAFSVFALTDNFKLLLFFSLFSALSESFISGADSALLYDYMKLANKLNEYDRTISSIHSLKFYFSAITAMSSSFLYDINKYLPLYCSLIFLLAAFITSCFLKEVESIEELSKNVSDKNIKNKFILYIQHIKESFKYVFNEREVLYTIFLYFIFTLFISNMNYLSQPYMKAIKIPIIYFGVIFFVFNIIAANSAKLSYIFKEKFGEKSLNIIMIQIAICFIALAVIHSWYSLIVLMLGRIANGLIWPLLDSQLNNKIPSEQRATIISLKSFVISLSFIIFDPIVGIMIDNLNIFKTYLILGFTLLIVCIFIKIRNIKYEKAYNEHS